MAAITISDLNNGKADLDHVAAIATSNALTAVDRLGREKKTIAGVLASIPDSGVVGKDTLVGLNEDLNHAAETVAFVLNDPDVENNTTYRKVGPYGEGQWIVSSASSLDALRTYIDGMLYPGDQGFSIIDAAGNAVMNIDEMGVARLVELVLQDGLSLDETRLLNNDQAFFSVSDEAGNAILALTEAELSVPGLSLGENEAKILRSDRAMEIADEIGGIAMAVEDDGSMTIPRLNAANQFRFMNEVRPADVPSDIVMVIGYGQSWAVGFQNTAISLSPRFDDLMFNGGIRTQCISEDPAVVMTSLVPAVERQDDHTPNFPAFEQGIGETTSRGTAEMIHEMLQSENNILPGVGRCQLLLTSPGEGSTSMEDLSEGSVCFTRLKKQILAGYQLAQAAGKTFSVGAVTWVQGIAAGGDAGYPAQLEALRLAVDVYAKFVCGQAHDVQLVTWQGFPAGGTEGIDGTYARQGPALDVYPHIHMTGGTYHFDNSVYDATNTSNTLHWTGLSTKWMGAYLGMVIKRVLFDKVPWIPLRPKSVRRQGALCTIDFHVPVGGLVVDTTRFHAQPSFGLNLYRADGVEIPLVGAVIAGPSRVTLRAAAAIPPGAFVRYGGTQETWGRYNGQGGNLRDQQGDLINFDGGGLDLPMHNWCIVFRETISN